MHDQKNDGETDVVEQGMGDTGTITEKENPAAQKATTDELVRRAHKGQLTHNTLQVKTPGKLSRNELIRTLTVCRNQANDWLHATIDIGAELLIVNPNHPYFKKDNFHESTMLRIIALTSEKLAAKRQKLAKEEKGIPYEMNELWERFKDFNILQMEFRTFDMSVIQSPLGTAFMQQLDKEMKKLTAYIWELPR